MATPTPAELEKFVSKVIAKKEVREALQNRDYKKAFELAGLGVPTKEQEVALTALAQDWSSLQGLAKSFNVDNGLAN